MVPNVRVFSWETEGDRACFLVGDRGREGAPRPSRELKAAVCPGPRPPAPGCVPLSQAPPWCLLSAKHRVGGPLAAPPSMGQGLPALLVGGGLGVNKKALPLAQGGGGQQTHSAGRCAGLDLRAVGEGRA